jgi:hypothetical protein
MRFNPELQPQTADLKNYLASHNSRLSSSYDIYMYMYHYLICLYVATPIVTQFSSIVFIVGKVSILISVVLRCSYLEYIYTYILYRYAALSLLKEKTITHIDRDICRSKKHLRTIQKIKKDRFYFFIQPTDFYLWFSRHNLPGNRNCSGHLGFRRQLC